MKKTITRPDGTTEVIEGTPEEIAAHERAVTKQQRNEGRKKPGVLKGISKDELRQIIRECIPAPQQVFQYTPVWLNPPTLWTCPTCGSQLCNGTHIFWDVTVAPSMISTETVTSNTFKIPSAAVGWDPSKIIS